MGSSAFRDQCLRQSIHWRSASGTGPCLASASAKYGTIPFKDRGAIVTGSTDNNIRVSLEELGLLNLSSIELADGSGAVASLSVLHSLHCLVI